MQPPKWATDLVAQVCKSHGKCQPKLFWHHRKSKHSWGRARPGSVTVYQGGCPIDARMLLLHELSHHLTGRKGGYGSRWHSKRFWGKAWRLYAKYGVPLEYAKQREFSYMAGAKRGYYRVKPYKKTSQR